MSAMREEGRVALVTGSARGIGAAIAERLAQDGIAIAINYSQSEQEAQAVAERIRALPHGKATVIKANLGNPEQAKALVERTVSEWGRLDILVNNAGMGIFDPIEAIKHVQLRAQFALNVEGTIFATQAAVPLPKEGGRIINLTATVQIHPSPGTSVYAATKGAIDALTRSWAQELGPKRVSVNAVGPGPVETDGFDALSTADVRQLLISRTSLGRIGMPSDIAAVVAFLASPDARWVTGQVLLANGGFLP